MNCNKYEKLHVCIFADYIQYIYKEQIHVLYVILFRFLIKKISRVYLIQIFVNEMMVYLLTN